MHYPTPQYNDAQHQAYSPIHLMNQGQITIEIERLVNKIRVMFKPIPLSRYGLMAEAYFDGMFFIRLIESLPRYLSIYSTRYQYSPHLDVFWQACRDIGLLIDSLGSNVCFLRLLSMDQAISLVKLIAAYTQSLRFHEEVQRRYYQVRENEKSLSDFATHIHQHYARVLVVRVDLHYRQEFQHLIKVEDIFAHRRSLFRMAEYSAEFEGLVARAWAIEQGSDTGGFHIHATFYFRGDRRQSDWAIGRNIGELWKQVTPYGRYFNCNTPEHKEAFRQRGELGIGMIHRNDELEVQNSIRSVTYLTNPEKVEQYLRIQPLRSRFFGKGYISALSKTQKRRVQESGHA